VAALHDRDKTVTLLIRAGAEPDTAIFTWGPLSLLGGQHCLFEACDKGYHQTVLALLVGGADPNVARWNLLAFGTLFSMSALGAAVSQANVEIVGLLLLAGADPESHHGRIGPWGAIISWTCLGAASALPGSALPATTPTYLTIVCALLEAGADTKLGFCVFCFYTHCAFSKAPSIERMLESYSASLTKDVRKGRLAEAKRVWRTSTATERRAGAALIPTLMANLIKVHGERAHTRK
jgi:hypothetical protein